MVVGSVFALERNSGSLHPLQGRYRISGRWDYQSFSDGLFGEEPVGKNKDCADSMSCTLYARVS